MALVGIVEKDKRMDGLESLEVVKVAISEGIAEVVLCRPKALNAINGQMLDELNTAFEVLEQRGDITCVILTGDGERAFVAGADIAAMSTLNVPEAQAFAERGHRVFERIEEFPAPVLAAVNGFALGGGCELALSCDIIYASERAKFGQPEVKLGLMPGFGGTVRLPRKIGLGAASEWIFTGEVYSAQKALAVGLVQELVAPEELLGRVRNIATLISQRGPQAVRASKRAMVKGLATDPRSAAANEQVQFGELFGTEDMREGTQAFLEKREPQFKGQ